MDEFEKNDETEETERQTAPNVTESTENTENTENTDSIEENNGNAAETDINGEANGQPAGGSAQPKISMEHRQPDIIDVIDKINLSGGRNAPQKDCFAEKDFSDNMFHSPMGGQPYNDRYGPQGGYGGYPPPPNPNMNMGQNAYYNGYGGYNGYNNMPNYAYPPSSPAMEPKRKKRLSGGGIAAIVLTVSSIFILVIIFLVISSMPKGKSTGYQGPKKDIPSVENPFSSSSVTEKNKNGSTVSVELPISAKPVLEPKYYEDEETGLLTVAGVAKQVSPSVVDVMVYRDTSLYPYSTGSGIIISEDGYIVTNAHVVAEMNAGLKVILDNDEEYKAEIIGQDSRTDIAVLKINAENLVSAELGDSDMLELGEMVVAIGNAGGYSGTLTVGYVSGLNREVKVSSGTDSMTCIQTDAAMSPGVSGGALINMYGQVVGITSSKYKTSNLDEGIGFAITTRFAKPIIEDIISKGYISGRVRVGITYTIIDDAYAELYDARRGILVQSIDDSCDIANTDLQVGDIIMTLNGHDIYSPQTISAATAGCEPGDVVSAHIFRKGITDEDSIEFDIEFELMQDTTLS